MTPKERAERITCWNWAAKTLGVAAGADRILGLVDVTAGVKLESLKPALELVIKSEPQGFLPSPGAVIAASKRLAERSASDRPKALNQGREMGPEEHRRWMADNNPGGWSDETWRAFIVRLKLDRAYAARVDRARTERHAWAAAECDRQADKRRTSAGFRIELRRQLNIEALDRFPRPDPFADGWKLPANAGDPLETLIASRSMPGSQAKLFDDSKGLEAARAASARTAQPNPRSWT